MCHANALTIEQQMTLESLPERFRKMFERITDTYDSRKRDITRAIFQGIMLEAGKSGEKAEEAVTEAKVEMPQGIYVRF